MRNRALAAVVALVAVAGSTPQRADALATKKYTQVTAGGEWGGTLACARATDGTAICWGSETYAFGDGGVSVGTGPVAVKASGTALSGKQITQIDAGRAHVCAALSDGGAVCWGKGDAGKLGNGQTANSGVAVAVKTTGTPLAGKTIKKVAAASDHTCALASDGTMACWGWNPNGQLGNGTTSDAATTAPVAVKKSGTALAGKTITDISAGGSLTCAVSSDGAVACWGRMSDAYGQAIINSTTAIGLPTSGTALAGKAFKQVDIEEAPYGGASHLCASTTDGNAGCIGEGSTGELGDGLKKTSTKWVAVKKTGTALAGATIKQMDVGPGATCASTTSGKVACWGSNSYGRLGIGVNDYQQGPMPTAQAVLTTTALQGAFVAGVQIGGKGSCAVATDDRVACWGGYLQLGNVVHSASPVGVPGTGPFGPFDSITASVNRQYGDVVKRAPTTSELVTWVNKISTGSATTGDLVAGLRASSENTTNVDPVLRLYWAYLGRIPDTSGANYWIKKHRAGMALSAISSNFAASSEFKTKYGSLSNSKFVLQVYTNVLGRQPDSSGLAYWTKQLDSGKKTRGQVMIGFSESSEYQRKMASKVAIVGLYLAVLHRSPTTSQLDSQVAKITGGATVAAIAQTLLASDEYWNLVH